MEINPTLKRYARKLLPRRLKPHRIWAGPLRGRLIVTSWHDYPGAIIGRTEGSLLAWFSRNVRPGETWLDVGAHYGYTALALGLLVGESGRVFAFEPMLSTVGCLARTRSLNALRQLVVVPLGLGCPSGFVELRSLPSARGMVDSTLKEQSARKEAFLVVRLDWLWPLISEPGQKIAGIKIDVQGMEEEVLRGMQEVLTRDRPTLVIEFHRGVSRESVLNLLCAVGYSEAAVPIDPVPGEEVPAFVDDRSYAFYPQTG